MFSVKIITFDKNYLTKMLRTIYPFDGDIDVDIENFFNALTRYTNWNMVRRYLIYAGYPLPTVPRLLSAELKIDNKAPMKMTFTTPRIII